MVLKPQDVVILLKLVVFRNWTYQGLAIELAMSSSEAHAGVRRAVAAGLMNAATTKSGHPIRTALLEFLIHGVKYAFPAVRGALTRGMPTAYAAPPLNREIVASNDPPPVWPDADGTVRGYSFAPLYSSVPLAAKRDQQLYELLALVDAIRDGRVRERQLAVKELEKRIRAAR